MPRTADLDMARANAVHDEIVAQIAHIVRPTEQTAAALLTAQARRGEADANLYRTHK